MKINLIISFLRFKVKFSYDLFMNKRNEKIFLIATPVHGNLGDQAIVMAEYKFLKEYYPNKKIIEVRNTDYQRFSNIIIRKIKNDDWIVIDGGGNLGTLWPDEDDKIGQILQQCCKNKIIIFPQTCFYELDNDGLYRLEKNRAIYNNCENLIVMLRDKNSFDFFSENFGKTKAIFTPDIVLSLHLDNGLAERKGVLLCLRKDKEKVGDKVDIEEIKRFLIKKNIEFSFVDTVINKTVTSNNREKEVNQKWNEFKSSKIVITDRLHGMIFSAITGTPCIAIDNYSKKVSGVYYKWLSHLPYLKMIEDNDGLKNEILFFCNSDATTYDFYLEFCFKDIYKEINL